MGENHEVASGPLVMVPAYLVSGNTLSNMFEPPNTLASSKGGLDETENCNIMGQFLLNTHIGVKTGLQFVMQVCSSRSTPYLSFAKM